MPTIRVTRRRRGVFTTPMPVGPSAPPPSAPPPRGPIVAAPPLAHRVRGRWAATKLPPAQVFPAARWPQVAVQGPDRRRPAGRVRAVRIPPATVVPPATPVARSPLVAIRPHVRAIRAGAIVIRIPPAAVVAPPAIMLPPRLLIVVGLRPPRHPGRLASVARPQFALIPSTGLPPPRSPVVARAPWPAVRPGWRARPIQLLPLAAADLNPDFQPHFPSSPDGAADYDVLIDATNRLIDTGRFDHIQINAPIGEGGAAVPDTAVAVAAILPRDWEDLDQCAAPIVVDEGACHFVVQLSVRESDDAQRYLLLSQLQTVVKDALNGQSLAGLTMPQLTICRRGRYDPAWRAPEQRAEMVVEYTMWVVGFGGF